MLITVCKTNFVFFFNQICFQLASVFVLGKSTQKTALQLLKRTKKNCVLPRRQNNNTSTQISFDTMAFLYFHLFTHSNLYFIYLSSNLHIINQIIISLSINQNDSPYARIPMQIVSRFCYGFMVV